MKLKEMLSKWKSSRAASGGHKSRHPVLAILLSVFVAVLLWFYVQDAESPDYKKTFTGVSVELDGLSSDLAVISGGETEVDITLSGKRADLNRIKVSDLEAFLDLSTVTEAGVYDQDVSVLLPEGTALYEVFPKTTSIFIDRTVSVSVPVTVSMGAYTVAADTSITPTPAVAEITVKGPRTIVETVDRAEIASGDLGEVTESFEKTLEYELLDASGAPVSSRHLVLPSRNVRVRFAVELTKTVPMVVKTVHNYWGEGAWRWSVSPETVAVKGEPGLMAGVTEVAALTVDETQFDTTRLNQKILPAEMALPQGVTLAETLGDVNVSVTLSGYASKTVRVLLSSSHVVVTPPALADGTVLDYVFDVDALILKVWGPSRTVRAATADDFYLNVDLSSFATPGQREVPVTVIQVDATEGQFYAVGTYSLNVSVLEPAA